MLYSLYHSKERIRDRQKPTTQSDQMKRVKAEGLVEPNPTEQEDQGSPPEHPKEPTEQPDQDSPPGIGGETSESNGATTDDSEDIADLVLAFLNESTEAELIDLPGIGPSRANKILSGQPFESLAEIQEVSDLNDEAWSDVVTAVETELGD